MIDNAIPTSAYDLLTPVEREVVDDYIEYIKINQRNRKERIALALKQPIPPEFAARGRGIILKPLPRAALTERIKEEAQKQDLSPDTLIQEYYNLAYANMEDYYDIGHYSMLQLKDWDSIPRDKLAAVKSVETKMTTTGLQTKLTLHDKRGAMDILAKLMGMVASDEAPLLEDYATDSSDKQDILNAPEDVYAQMLEDD